LAIDPPLDLRCDRYDLLRNIRVAHDRNAILGAGARARDGSIYVFGKPVCARAGTIIQAGVKRVVAQEPKEGTDSKWDKSGQIARKMLDEATIEFMPTSN
jgi:dCMP deaminase